MTGCSTIMDVTAPTTKCPNKMDLEVVEPGKLHITEGYHQENRRFFDPNDRASSSSYDESAPYNEYLAHVKLEECYQCIKQEMEGVEIKIEDDDDYQDEKGLDYLGDESYHHSAFQNVGEVMALGWTENSGNTQNQETPLSFGYVDVDDEVVRKVNLELLHREDNLYYCDLCEYKAKLPGHMAYHRMTHTGEKPYRCKFCDFVASHPTTVRRHMRRHTGEKPHACKFCDYKAAQPIALQNHIRRMHTGEKPYACDVCSFKTYDQGTMGSHKLTHLHPDEKPFECDECGMRMNRRWHLKRHADSKHPGKKISLERRSNVSRMGLQRVSGNANRSHKRFPKKKILGCSESIDSCPSLSSDDDTETPSFATVSSEDNEYRPNVCLTSFSPSNLIDRPRRRIVAPVKLDL